LQFVDTLEISKRDFYDKTGISRGTLESQTGITEETLTKFFATYSNINPIWILTGEGSMEKLKDFEVLMDPEVKYQVKNEAYNNIISRKEEKVNKLTERIERLKSEITTLKNH